MIVWGHLSFPPAPYNWLDGGDAHGSVSLYIEPALCVCGQGNGPQRQTRPPGFLSDHEASSWGEDALYRTTREPLCTQTAEESHCTEVKAGRTEARHKEQLPNLAPGRGAVGSGCGASNSGAGGFPCCWLSYPHIPSWHLPPTRADSYTDKPLGPKT